MLINEVERPSDALFVSGRSRGFRVDQSSLGVSSFAQYRAVALFVSRCTMKFILVNGRTPRSHSFCAVCNDRIEENYLRDVTTSLTYCDCRCYAERRVGTAVTIRDCARAS